MFMRVMNSARHLRDQFHRAPNRHRLAPGHFVELSAFDEFHAEITRAIVLADFVNGNDARMIEACSGFGFPAKACQVRLAPPLTKANDL
jgi:hypothetical protein